MGQDHNLENISLDFLKNEQKKIFLNIIHYILLQSLSRKHSFAYQTKTKRNCHVANCVPSLLAQIGPMASDSYQGGWESWEQTFMISLRGSPHSP